jgi:PAS domain S-box-containing protein
MSLSGGGSSPAERELERLREELTRTREAFVRSEQALRDAEEHATNVFRFAPCVMVITTLDDFTILDVNDAFVAESGYAREAVIGKRSTDFPWWPSAEARDRLVASLRRDGFLRDLETRFVSHEGVELVTMLNARRITVKGVPCVLTHTADITERTRAEAERHEAERARRDAERLESLGLVAGGIAHDFNNLLVGILGNAELMLATCDAPESDPRPTARHLAQRRAGRGARARAPRLRGTWPGQARGR